MWQLGQKSCKYCHGYVSHSHADDIAWSSQPFYPYHAPTLPHKGYSYLTKDCIWKFPKKVSPCCSSSTDLTKTKNTQMGTFLACWTRSSGEYWPVPDATSLPYCNILLWYSRNTNCQHIFINIPYLQVRVLCHFYHFIIFSWMTTDSCISIQLHYPQLLNSFLLAIILNGYPDTYQTCNMWELPSEITYIACKVS